MNRKTIIFCIACGLWFGLFTLSLQAALIGYEAFLLGDEPNDGEYSGTQLGSQNPTVAGWSGDWSYQAGQSSSTSLDASGLSYPGLSGEGGALRLQTSGVRVTREFSNILSNGAVYISFMMQLNNTDAAYRVFELHRSTGTGDSERTLQVGIGGTAGGDFPSVDHWGVRVNNDSDYNAQLAAKDTDVNLFVVKLEYNSGSENDRVLVWQNPSLTSSEPVTDAEFSDITLQNVRYMSLARFGSDSANEVTFDEIRVGTTWASVIPEPGTFIFMVLGGLLFWLRRRMI